MNKPSKNTRTTSLDVQAIRRHILATMGVGLWVDKACPTQQTAWSGRMDSTCGGVFDKLKPKDPKPKKPSDSTPSEAKNSEEKYSRAIDTQIKNKSAPDVPPPRPQKKHYLQQAVATATKFKLVGMRYRHWVLLADDGFMTTQTQGVWQSLQDTLKKEAAKTGAVFVSHFANYDHPKEQDEYPEHANFSSASPILQGFLFGLFLQKMDISGVCVAMLTPLSDGIVFGETIGQTVVQLPMLEQMINDPSLKKQLWDTLHA